MLSGDGTTQLKGTVELTLTSVKPKESRYISQDRGVSSEHLSKVPSRKVREDDRLDFGLEGHVAVLECYWETIPYALDVCGRWQ